jgi:hypothetical protein
MNALDDLQAENAVLRMALRNCGWAAHFGGELYDSKRRGAREKLAYIEREVANVLPHLGPPEVRR